MGFNDDCIHMSIAICHPCVCVCVCVCVCASVYLSVRVCVCCWLYVNSDSGEICNDLLVTCHCDTQLSKILHFFLTYLPTVNKDGP